jgi:hypothetical protein
LGYQGQRFKLRSELRDVITGDTLPDYRIALDTSRKPDHVVVYPKDAAKVAKHVMSENLYDWWNSLERSEKVGA